MRVRCCLPLLCLLALVLGTFSLRSSAYAQTDAAASFYGAFTGTTTANGTVQSPSNSAGVLLELRHISNPLVGYELNYSFNRANQNYNNLEEIKAGAHQVGFDWVVSFPVLMLRPFVLAGGGILFFHPDSNQPDSRSETKPVFVYGAGLDWKVLRHIGVRCSIEATCITRPTCRKPSRRSMPSRIRRSR